MVKIISLFQRNYDGDRLVRDELVTGAEWVANGEGVATRKWDGTCCRIKDGKLYRRYDAKQGKTPPPGFEPAQDYDPITGHMPGWIEVGDGPEDKWHRIGWENTKSKFPEGDWPGDIEATFELCGPHIQGNPECEPQEILIRHGSGGLEEEPPRDFAGLKEFFSRYPIEGIVWHHPDGRMVKIKGKDFGVKRKSLELVS